MGKKTGKQHRNATNWTEISERRAYAVSLRRTGATYREIAQSVIEYFGAENVPASYSHGLAYQDVQKELKRHAIDMREELDHILELEIQRLDRMLLAIWPGVQRGHLGAVDRALKIQERRAKFLGLDAPKQTTVSAGKDTSITFEVAYGEDGVTEDFISEDD